MNEQEINIQFSSIDNDLQEIQKQVHKFYNNIQDDRAILEQIRNQIRKTQSTVSRLRGQSAILKEDARLVAAEKRLNAIGSEMIPRTGSLFVRLMLGRVNVKHYSTQDRQQLKDEYEKFKDRTAWVFLLFVLAQLLTMATVTPLAISFQVWLLYYYTTLALREHILRVNGSQVKMWWIYHHYLSIGISLTSLLWSSDSFHRFYPQFLWFSLYQATLQILLNRYQQARLYKQRALGKATRLDVAGEMDLMVDRGPSFGCAPNLLILFPLILGAHLFQMYNAFRLFEFVFNTSDDFPFEPQPLILGLLFLIVSIGNLFSTIEVYLLKWKNRNLTSPIRNQDQNQNQTDKNE